MIKIQVLQHVDFEKPAAIYTWANSKGYKISITRLYKNEPLPHLSSFDWLIIMGGPMGVEDESIYPWMYNEKIFIKNIINSGKRVLGICLGAQLIAETLGAKIYQNKEKEIGWQSVELSPWAYRFPFFKQFPFSFTAFHWHGQSFELPKGAVRLFQNSITPNQGFLYKKNVLALQFHFETTYQSMNMLIKNAKKDLTPGFFVQSPHTMFLRENTRQIHTLLFQLLDQFEKGF